MVIVMRLKELQSILSKLLAYSFPTAELPAIIDGNDDFEMVLSAKIMASDLLKEQEPKKVLLDAFLQLILVASLINLDLEKEVEKIMIKYSHFDKEGS